MSPLILPKQHSWQHTGPLISCILLTYNRINNQQNLIGEAVQSFLMQQYKNRELIIVNDTPGQELCYSSPLIKIINLSDRFATLSEKHNAAIAWSSGDYIVLWDDDDISLPWRLSASLSWLFACGTDYFNHHGFWSTYGQLHYSTKMIMPTSIYSRWLFDQVGGYPLAKSGGDALFFRKLPTVHRHCFGLIQPENVHYIYRWQPTHQHVSSRGGSYDIIGTQPIISGRFTITPEWKRDYVSDTRQLLAVSTRQ